LLAKIAERFDDFLNIKNCILPNEININQEGFAGVGAGTKFTIFVRMKFCIFVIVQSANGYFFAMRIIIA